MSIDPAESRITSNPNTVASSYIRGIWFTKTNVVVKCHVTRGANTFFTAAFAAAFVGLAGAVYRLREQIRETKVSPLLEKKDMQDD